MFNFIKWHFVLVLIIFLGPYCLYIISLGFKQYLKNSFSRSYMVSLEAFVIHWKSGEIG